MYCGPEAQPLLSSATRLESNRARHSLIIENLQVFVVWCNASFIAFIFPQGCLSQVEPFRNGLRTLTLTGALNFMQRSSILPSMG
ncbi:hypothetical protein BN2475_50098 [Paraburkholderia ribeironis]|uniref:Uncharacterized protein n=1 Tax=Paraburkholderia ribeironis TaxID=1247936 RepID=A0A1N7RKG6_9BURK|nr:hypothetical protein BN2475_50098 [Paraburkholderia ribeironis]